MKKIINNAFANVKNKRFVEGVSSRFFLRHIPFIIIGTFFAFTYISLRFDCLTAQETIIRLQDRLNSVRTETRAERAQYLSATGESTMLKRVNELGLGLHLQEQPPYIIEINK